MISFIFESLGSLIQLEPPAVLGLSIPEYRNKLATSCIQEGVTHIELNLSRQIGKKDAQSGIAACLLVSYDGGYGHLRTGNLPVKEMNLSLHQ